MSSEGKKIQESTFLVTGGAGFIGSHIVDFLIDKGAKKVRVLDNFSTGDVENLQGVKNAPNFELMEGDITSVADCEKACEGIDYVSHQAALGSVPRSIENPLATNEVNIGGFLNILEGVKKHEVKRIVYASSSSVYGDSPDLPKKEQNIGKPLSPYAVSKLTNEIYADVFAKTYGIEIIGLRYFNVFGPKQKFDGAYAAVVPLFFQAVKSGAPAFINGDGKQSRDFTYVDNAVQANIKALFTENGEALNKAYNVACGERASINELLQKIAHIMGAEPHATHRDDRAGDVKHSLADISLAKDLLNYTPEVKIEHGLELTSQWYK